MRCSIFIILLELVLAAFTSSLPAAVYRSEIIVRTIQNLANERDVDRLVNDAYENNIATIVIGVKQDEDDEAPSGYVFYDSDVAPSVNGFESDALLKSLISKAHDKGLAVKAWLPQFHDKAAIEKNAAWQMMAYNGSSVFPYTANGAAWFINPIHPRAQAYELAIIKEVLQKFDFDGIVLDWIRFDDYNMDLGDITRNLFKAEFGYDPITINFASDNSKRRQWNAWREDHIAAYIHKVDSLIETIKPGLPLGVYILSPEWQEVAQNPAKFRDVVDYVAPMCYYDDWGYPLDWIYGPRDDAILLVTKNKVGDGDIVPVFDADWSDADYKNIFEHLADDYSQINTVGWFEYGRWSRQTMARIHKVSQFGRPFPVDEGKIVFHRYTDYAAGDGELFIYDFDKKRLDNISNAWRNSVHHTINGHFSPDGKKIVFMGLPKGKSSYYDWDVYLWEIGDGAPQNLTAGNGLPDEDPKFFADGRRIVFKQNGDIKIMDIVTKKITAVTSDGFSVEESMPYPTPDGQQIVYAKSSRTIAHSQIHIMDVDGGGGRLLSDETVASYYPIVRDAESFLYPRWASTANHHDQVYLAYFSGKEAVRCPFNDVSADNSDPFPVPGTNYVFFSSNRKGGSGSWDIYLGDLESGDVWPLASGVNSGRAELGVGYFSDSSTIIIDPPPPKDYHLGQNYPNPFNASTKISFSLAESAYVKIDLFDARGRFVQRLLQRTMPTGAHSLEWTPENLGSGVYFYRLSTANFSQVKKCVYLQ